MPGHHGAGGGAPAPRVTPVDEWEHTLAAGELLARHVVQRGVAVDEHDVVMLAGSRTLPSATRLDPAWRASFVAALQRVCLACGTEIGELRALESRLTRLQPDVAQALRLLSFAAARGRVVDEALAKPILEAGAAAEAGRIDGAQEQAFLVAYRRLAAEMAPVSGATLAASEQRIPRPADLLAHPQRFFDDLCAITLGRFAHFVLFTAVLLCAGATIAYQTVGEAAFTRHEAMGRRLDDLKAEQGRAKAAERERQRALFTLVDRRDTRGDDIAQTDLRLREATAELARLEQVQQELQRERQTLTAMLRSWTDQPCRSPYVGWICGYALTSRDQLPTDSEIVFDAEMALKRLNQIVLPMLLGLLGAYSFVLRTLSREIRERSFEEHSALHHVARLSLGALAGIAVGWLLKPEQIGLLASVPAWVMAFVAGYGIELVFTFLDRIVSAFTSKQGASGR